MSPKTILVLAGLTLVTAVVALVAVLAEPDTSRIVLEGEPAFPVLREAPDTVRTILVRSSAGEVALERQEDGSWVATTAYGYPAASERVRNLVVGLADMQLIEAKTRNPERFARLQVEDVRAEDSKSRLVRLADAEGETLAAVLVGKTRDRLTGTERGGTYIRRLGEDQSWLATGRLELPPPGAAWLDRRVIDLPAEQVVRVEVEPPAGPDYALVRDGDTWTMARAPGRLAEASAPEELAGALARLPFEAVRPAQDLASPGVPWRFRLTSADGLEVAFTLAEVEDLNWVRFDAVTARPDAEQAVVERAAAIVGRTEGWAYRLPEALGQRLRRPREAWLEDGGSS